MRWPLERPCTAARIDAQRPYLPVKIGPLDAERPGRIADPAVVLLEDGGDVVALETRPRLAERAAVQEGHRVAVEPDVREDILEADAAAARQPRDEALDERAQLEAVAAPWQRRDQRQ